MTLATIGRVEYRTRHEYNQRIRRQTERNVERFRGAPWQAIDGRIRELEREWDIERGLDANAAGLALAGLALGILAEEDLVAVLGEESFDAEDPDVCADLHGPVEDAFARLPDLFELGIGYIREPLGIPASALGIVRRVGRAPPFGFAQLVFRHGRMRKSTHKSTPK
jgi:hypothetical protein